tara:strand:- start:460 stop:654 length:195 start_codon:yes stop_codon:yes gene_type:complete
MTSSDVLFTDQIDKLVSDYGECKIDTMAYVAGLKELGITTIFEIHDYIEKAEEARYEYKLDNAG